MNTAPLRSDEHFPQEVPRFQPPLPRVLTHVEGKIENMEEASEAYFRERETFVTFWENDADALEEIVSRFSLTGGNPRLEDLINQAGEHLERVHAELLPRIEENSKLRKDAAALRIPRAKELMTSIIDRNLSLMRRYVKAIEAIYDRLIGLRDRSIQQSVSSLTTVAWAGVWDDDD